MKKNLYRGYSSFEYQRNKTFVLTDIELVKMDLLNHIYTRRGERVMMPDFGTSIPDIVFEPLDNRTLEQLRRDLELVFNYDPRVKLLDLKITPNFDSNAVNATARLLYVELDFVDEINLNLQFENA
jgi:phage baseplate assembly protein W